MLCSFRFVSALIVCALLSVSTAHAETMRLADYLQRFVTSGQQLIYSDRVVPAETAVDVGITAGNPSEAGLREVLAPLGLGLAAGPADSLLIIRLTPANATTVGAISGVVRNADGKRIEGARVSLGRGAVALTDAAGYFNFIDLDVGSHRLMIAASGMRTAALEAVTVNDDKVTVVAVALSLAPVDLGSLIITSSRYNLEYRYPGSHTLLDQALLSGLPSLGDEPLRATERLPGTASGGLSSRNHVRGGEVNEVLVVLDGLRLYEPFHLKDFQSPTSLISKRAIESIDYYSGGFPARYGDRMSAVMDIALRRPIDTLRTELELSFFNTSAASLGTFADGRGEWLVSARRGNLDLLLKRLENDFGTPSYADGLAHISWEVSNRTAVSGNLLFLEDKANVVDSAATENARANYTNRYAWLRIKNDWSESVTSDTVVSATQIDHVRSGSVNDPMRVTGSLDESRNFKVFGLKQDWGLRFAERLVVSAGFDLKRLEADYRYSSAAIAQPPFDAVVGAEPLVSRDLAAAPRGGQHAVYLQGRWQWRDTLVFDAGLRWDQQNYTTASDDDQLSPRLSVLFTPRQGSEFRLSWGRYYQAQEINELQLNAGLDEFFPAQRSEHTILSLSQQLPYDLDLRLELYRKKARGLQPRFENLFDPLVLLPELRPDRIRIDAASAIARGVELMLSQQARNRALRWWVSYSWSEVADSSVQGDVLRSWDQTHAVKGGVLWDRGPWSLSAAATVHTGWPRTTLSFVQQQLVTGPRNGERYNVFHTLDVRASRQFDVSRGVLSAFFEISNLYNRGNQCCTRYSIASDANGVVLREAQRDWLPIVPSLGVAWEF